MRRIVSNILVAVLTFVVGVVISPIRFELKAMGHGSVPDGGGPAVGYGYRSSYFTELGYGSESYPSPEKAREVFERRLAEAVRPIERTQKFNERGEVVGERAVAMFAGDSGGQYASIIWTEGRVFCTIRSPSLMHVYAFEKQAADGKLP